MWGHRRGNCVSDYQVTMGEHTVTISTCYRVTSYYLTHFVLLDPLRTTWPTSYYLTHFVQLDPLRTTWPTSYYLTHFVLLDPLRTNCLISYYLTHFVLPDPLRTTWPTSYYLSHLHPPFFTFSPPKWNSAQARTLSLLSSKYNLFCILLLF